MRFAWTRDTTTSAFRRRQVEGAKERFSDQVPERWTDSKGRTWLIYFHLEGLWRGETDSRVRGSLEAFGVTILSEDGETMPFSFFREIPLATIWEDIRAREAEEARILMRSDKPHHPAWEEVADAYVKEGEIGRRGRRYGIEHYMRVAQLYEEALRLGLPPTKYVAENLDVSRSAAGKQVSVARNTYGFLGPTEKRKAGGIEETPMRRQAGRNE